MEFALQYLGHYDVREVGPEKSPLIDTLDAFIFKFQLLCYKSDYIKRFRKEILEFSQNVGALTTAIEQDWNISLPLRKVKKRKQAENKLEETQAVETIDIYTPVVKKKVKFAKVSPRMDLVKFQCTAKDCNRFFDYKRSLQRHLDTDHAEENIQIGKDVKENTHFVTCRMCLKKLDRSKIIKHLENSHGVRKEPGTAGVFRGFILCDEGENWDPLFLQKEEDDPPENATLMVPIKDNMITVYGVQFQVEEMEHTKRDDNNAPEIVLDEDDGLSVGLKDAATTSGFKRKLFRKVDDHNNDESESSPIKDYHNDDDESESSHLQDYHNEGDESESAPIQELKSQEGTIIRGKVRIKVTLILVPVDEIQDADGLENTVEEFITDSDYESSDTIDYDTNRNEMKTMR